MLKKFELHPKGNTVVFKAEGGPTHYLTKECLYGLLALVIENEGKVTDAIQKLPSKVERKVTKTEEKLAKLKEELKVELVA